MDIKDVKVGMKVVPHSKSRWTSWDKWAEDAPENHKFFKENGWLYVKTVGNDINLSCAPDGNYGSAFNASDFEPAVIEVGDVVRLGCRCHNGVEGVVFARECDGALFINVPNGLPIGVNEGSKPDLVRKARKPAEPEKPAERRPTVGDWVEVLAKPECGHKVGDIGKVVPSSGIFPYLVDVNGKQAWYRANEVKLTTAPAQPSEKPREFKVGDPVRFINRDKHKASPEFYPVCGTKGVVKRLYHNCIDVKWPSGYTSGSGLWACGFGDVEIVSEPATVLCSEAEAAVRRAYLAGQAKAAAKIVIDCNPSAETLASFFEADA